MQGVFLLVHKNVELYQQHRTRTLLFGKTSQETGLMQLCYLRQWTDEQMPEHLLKDCQLLTDRNDGWPEDKTYHAMGNRSRSTLQSCFPGKQQFAMNSEEEEEEDQQSRE
jgi:hypothetical protein